MELLSELETLVEEADLEELRVFLNQQLQQAWSREGRDALQVAQEVLDREGGLTREGLQEIQDGLSPVLGGDMARVVEGDIRDVADVSYRIGKDQVTGAGLGAALNMVDRRAINWLGENNVYWIRNHYDNEVRDRIQRAGLEVLEEGLGRREAGQRFRERLAPVFGQSQSYWDMHSANVVTRSAEFGRIEGYVESGASRVRIDAIQDHRTSDICNELHGTTLPVEGLVEQRDQMMDAEDPEDVKEAAPWLKPDRVKDLAEQGEQALLDAGIGSPPYHGNCRTRTVIE